MSNFDGRMVLGRSNTGVAVSNSTQDMILSPFLFRVVLCRWSEWMGRSSF